MIYNVERELAQLGDEVRSRRRWDFGCFRRAAQLYLELVLDTRLSFRRRDVGFARPEKLTRMAQEDYVIARWMPSAPCDGHLERRVCVGLYDPRRARCLATNRWVEGLDPDLPLAQSEILVHESGHRLVDEWQEKSGSPLRYPPERRRAEDAFCAALERGFRQRVSDPEETQDLRWLRAELEEHLDALVPQQVRRAHREIRSRGRRTPHNTTMRTPLLIGPRKRDLYYERPYGFDSE